MSANVSRFLVLGLIILLCLAGWANSAQKIKSTRQTAWEYKIVYTASEDELNKLGAEGWDLTAAYISPANGGAHAPYCILKRAK